MAEALLRHADNEHFEVYSAGTDLVPINPSALSVLERAGVSVEGLYSKSLPDLESSEFDVVITLCDKAAQECKRLPQNSEVLAWSFEDPATSKDPRAFEHTLQAIHDRIKLFVLVKTKR
ncbi:arsenate reductase ArsC [Cellvibrio sp. KY-GH-1]|jgi:ArsR family transcriptional regulator|uniref:arsenate reductase/protein-tyrosine-phosphatase family protein n=1 Tax=Cellvibrio sp. KY-GH-1 TaxID=2303332 RepID=UPI002104DC91|nr:arsenate reductase ArsC [Cellvibrio sp. KY-GH-1]